MRISVTNLWFCRLIRQVKHIDRSLIRNRVRRLDIHRGCEGRLILTAMGNMVSAVDETVHNSLI